MNNGTLILKLHHRVKTGAIRPNSNSNNIFARSIERFFCRHCTDSPGKEKTFISINALHQQRKEKGLDSLN